MFPDFQVSLFLTLQSAQSQMEAVCHFSEFKLFLSILKYLTITLQSAQSQMEAVCHFSQLKLFLSILKYLTITDHLIKINENT
jgi:hypothetical protein